MVQMLTVYLDFDRFIIPPPSSKITPHKLLGLKIAQRCYAVVAFHRVPLEELKSLTQTPLLDLGAASLREGQKKGRMEKRKRGGEVPRWETRKRIEEGTERTQCEGRESHPLQIDLPLPAVT